MRGDESKGLSAQADLEYGRQNPDSDTESKELVKHK